MVGMASTAGEQWNKTRKKGLNWLPRDANFETAIGGNS